MGTDTAKAYTELRDQIDTYLTKYHLHGEDILTYDQLKHIYTTIDIVEDLARELGVKAKTLRESRDSTTWLRGQRARIHLFKAEIALRLYCKIHSLYASDYVEYLTSVKPIIPQLIAYSKCTNTKVEYTPEFYMDTIGLHYDLTLGEIANYENELVRLEILTRRTYSNSYSSYVVQMALAMMYCNSDLCYINMGIDLHDSPELCREYVMINYNDFKHKFILNLFSKSDHVVEYCDLIREIYSMEI